MLECLDQVNLNEIRICRINFTSNSANSAESVIHWRTLWWASECLDIKNYKWRLNPVWHGMLYVTWQQQASKGSTYSAVNRILRGHILISHLKTIFDNIWGKH